MNDKIVVCIRKGGQRDHGGVFCTADGERRSLEKPGEESDSHCLIPRVFP